MLVTVYASVLLLNKHISCIYQLPTRFVPSSYHVRIFPLAIEANKKRKRYEHGATGRGMKWQAEMYFLLEYFM